MPLFEEIHRPFCERIGRDFAFVFHNGNLAFVVTIGMASEVLNGVLKSLLSGAVRRAPSEVPLVMPVQMPLSKERRVVTGFVQIFGYRLFLKRKVQRKRRCRER